MLPWILRLCCCISDSWKLKSNIEERIHNLSAVRNNGFVWIDVQKPSRQDINLIANEFGFHELNIDDSLSKNQLPKIDRYPDHIFMVLHFPVLQKDGGNKNTIARPSQVSFFAGDHYLVTVHQGDLRPLGEMFELCSSDEKQREEIMGRSSGYLMHSIIDAMVDNLLHMLIKTIGNLDDIEDLVFDERVSAAKQISLVRREITSLRRVVLPMKRTLLDFITRDMARLSEEDLTLYYADIREHLEQVLESLDEAKETIDIYKDTDYMLSTEKSNKILGLLTIAFTFTIPAAVLGTFFGMNVITPGSISEPWGFLGPYTTLIIILICSLVPPFFMHLYFKKQGWIVHSY
jgi:magnesium transporter